MSEEQREEYIVRDQNEVLEFKLKFKFGVSRRYIHDEEIVRKISLYGCK